MRFLGALFLIFTSLHLRAQEGHYYLSHYTSERQGSTLSFDMTQDPSGLMYFATRTGLKQFDGRNWRAIEAKGIAYTLSLASDGRVFAAGEGVVGFVRTLADFSLELSPIITEQGVDFFESAVVKDDVYVVNEKEIVVYNVVSNSIKRIKLPADEEGFANLFELLGVAYVSTFDGSLYKVEGTKLQASSLSLKSPVAFTTGLGNHYFIVTEDQHCYLLKEGGVMQPVRFNDQSYLTSGVIVSGAWVSQKLVALGTLNGGVVFVDPSTGKTEEIINYFSGLPDNEVFCMKRDAEGNVWVGHEYGYSCISPSLPFRSFNHYEGLQGNILCAKTFANNVYVGTSVGLFILEKQDQYAEEVYYVEKRTTSKSSGPVAAIPTEPAPKQESKKKGFLRFRKNKEKEAEGATPTVKNEVTDTKPKSAVTRIRQTRKILLGSTYSFKRVAGIDSKVERLLTANGALYASGLAGLFEIQQAKALPLVQEPVEVVSATHQHGIVGETYQSRVFAWKDNTQTTLIEDIHDDVSSIVEDAGGTLWIAGTKSIYQFVEGKSSGTYAYSNPTLDRTEGMNLKGKSLFVNSNGFYTVLNGAVRVIDSLGKPSQFFAAGNNLWYRRNETWRCLGSFQDHQNLEYLNVFTDLRFIETEEETEALWIVTKNNELFRFHSNEKIPQSTVYPLFVRSLRNQQQFFEPNHFFYRVGQHEGEISIEAVQAAFGSQQGAQYRYLLEGLEPASWTEWSSNNQINFPFLPLGSYTLKLQTRDLLGKVNELKPIQLKIEPPFWKTPWFYAMEFAIFSVLVVLSIRLQALNNRYRVIAQVLAMLTIVLLITLIQAAFSTYLVTTSPIIDFGVQVGVAFLVLPVEIFLRKVMFSASQKNRLYQIINPSLKKPTDTI